MAVFLAAAAVSGRGIRRNGQDLREQLAAEEMRVEKIREVQRNRLAARQEQHARQVRAWEERREAFDRQLQWYAVSLPGEVDRVDLAGGTLPGWSALLTMIAAPRLSAGGDVTVLDLTEGAVAGDLLAVARRSGIEPLIWVLPGDLPRLDLGTGLDGDALADVLAATVAAAEQGVSAGGPAGSAPVDNTILHRILGVLGPEASIAQVTAALRVLAQVGDPREHLRGGLLTADQVDRVTALFGRAAADRVVIERAWAIESRLRRLDELGSAPVPLPRSRLRVACLDRRVGALGNKVLGTYLTVALTHLLRQAPAGRAGGTPSACSARRSSAPMCWTSCSRRARSPAPGWSSGTARSQGTSGSGSAAATRPSRSCGSATPTTPGWPASRSAPSTVSWSAS